MAEYLDALTLFLACGLTYGLLAMILFFVRREHWNPGLGLLAGGHLLIVAGTIFVPNVPRVLVNGSSVVGTALLLEGVRQFYGMRSWRPLIFVAGGLILLSHPIQQGGSTHARIAVTVGLVALLLALTAWSAWHGGRGEGVYTRLVAGAFAVFALAAGGRAVLAAARLRVDRDPVAGDPVAGLMLLVASLCAILWTLGILLTMNRRLLVAVETANRRLEQLAREAELASRVKSDFVANLSHEIRTPLNGVLGSSHLLQRGPLLPAQREQVETLRACGEQLLGTVNAILDFSKLEAGKLELESVPFDLRAAVRAVMAVHRPEAQRKDLALREELAAELPEFVLGDPVRLRQALSNLVANAVKFTGEGAVIVKVRPAGMRIRFEVEDTGVGVGAEAGERLFQSFSQADASTTRRFGGTGLGLAIVRHLATLMGGEAGYENLETRGSRFYFEVELPATEKTPTGAVKAEKVAARPAKILLAEDNDVNRMIAVALLSEAGHQVEVASDGHQAVAACLGGDFDLVLMDCQMPNLDGFAATREIRRGEARGSRLPIIALTASSLAGDRANCLAAGMDDHIGKPIDPEELAAKLARWLGDAESS